MNFSLGVVVESCYSAGVLTNGNLVLEEVDIYWHLTELAVLAQLESPISHQLVDVVSVVTEPESCFPVVVPLASEVSPYHHWLVSLLASLQRQRQPGLESDHFSVNRELSSAPSHLESVAVTPHSFLNVFHEISELIINTLFETAPKHKEILKAKIL